MSHFTPRTGAATRRRCRRSGATPGAAQEPARNGRAGEDPTAAGYGGGRRRRQLGPATGVAMMPWRRRSWRRVHHHERWPLSTSTSSRPPRPTLAARAPTGSSGSSSRRRPGRRTAAPGADRAVAQRLPGADMPDAAGHRPRAPRWPGAAAHAVRGSSGGGSPPRHPHGRRQGGPPTAPLRSLPPGRRRGRPTALAAPTCPVPLVIAHGSTSIRAPRRTLAMGASAGSSGGGSPARHTHGRRPRPCRGAVGGGQEPSILTWGVLM
jgi:hypothetical protein